MRTRRTKRAPYSVNVLKVSSEKNGHMERRGGRTMPMLTSPNYARKVAIFMKNTSLLGQFKTKREKEKIESDILRRKTKYK